MQISCPLLESLEYPDDLRQLDESQLEQLASELRKFLVTSVAGSGGHLAAGLGTVELTIALHYVFNTPHDRLVWDVGHQTYPHKILTGRRGCLNTIRQKNGLAGFPSRDESSYDSFGVGHAGTSVSAALGMAIAVAHREEPRQVVAVIGDGAMSTGMAFEALNHAGDLDADLLVILNDNSMSISPNVGGMSSYLTRILTGKLYSSVREGGKKVLSHMPPMKEIARRAEEHMKGMVSPGTLFEELGFHYFGPVDGHDTLTLVKILHNLKSLKGPRFLHVVTRKGKGYGPAEDDPVSYHGVGPFEPGTGVPVKPSVSTPTYTRIFGDWLCDTAAVDEGLVAITPAMCEGSGMVEFAERYPQRFFDVGIAEQHAVTLAAGLACEGMKPVVAIYSTFLQRAYDQVIHDVAIQNLPVLFAVDRAGLVGPDGVTHAGSFDLSYLRCIPNLVIMAPADENECRRMLDTGHRLGQPAVVRYPRGRGPGVAVCRAPEPLLVGQGELRRAGGSRIAFLSFGSLLEPVLQAAEQLDASVVNMRFVRPLDETLLLKVAAEHEFLVTVEDNVVAGGAGSAVNESLAGHHWHGEILNLGLPDRYIAHATRAEQLAECGLDTEGIRKTVVAAMQHSTAGGDGQRVVRL